MPCHDPRGDGDMRELDEQRQAATRAACEALAFITRNGALYRMSAETRAWYVEHRVQDAQRTEK